jgi:hypothetical protein
MPAIVSKTLDNLGRVVVLDQDRWKHIKEENPILTRRLRAIVAAVRQPSFHCAGRDEREEWYFTDEALGRGWVRVVVHYEGDEGWIVTAFPCDPPRPR